MRRAGAWAVLGAAVLAVAGCTPAGTDGDLTNGWAAFPAAKTATPAVGACYPTAYQPTWKGDFSTAVDCAGKTHETETVYVGAFTGADANRDAPPLAGSDARKTAFAQCGSAARDYLGGDWSDARVTLGLVVPDDAAWSGGARWYRCDIEQYHDSALQSMSYSGSVKGGLSGARPLAIACITVTDDGKGSVTGWTDGTCDQPHNGEYAGTYTASDTAWPTDVTNRHNLAKSGCESVVAQFLGFSGSTYQSNYLGWMATGFDEDRWTAGDRTERCFVLAITGSTANSTRILGSVKGLRDGAPHKA